MTKTPQPILVEYAGDTVEVQYLDDYAEFFMGAVAIFYGPRKSGKTTTVKNIMFHLQREFGFIWLYSPNHKLNNDFGTIVPKPLIHTTLNINKLKIILSRQTKLVEKYQLSTSKLDKMYELTKEEDSDDKLKILEKAFSHDMEKVNKLKTKYKRKIVKKNSYMITDKSLLCYCENLFINPNILVILDDASMELSSLLEAKDNDTKDTLRNIFFEGRHKRITIFFIIHDVTSILPPKYRKNSDIHIFCDKEMVHSWFGCASHTIDKETKKKAYAIANTIFKDRNNKSRKLIFHKGLRKYFYMDTVYDLPKFEMCSGILKRYCDSIEKQDG